MSPSAYKIIGLAGFQRLAGQGHERLVLECISNKHVMRHENAKRLFCRFACQKMIGIARPSAPIKAKRCGVIAPDLPVTLPKLVMKKRDRLPIVQILKSQQVAVLSGTNRQDLVIKQAFAEQSACGYRLRDNCQIDALIPFDLLTLHVGFHSNGNTGQGLLKDRHLRNQPPIRQGLWRNEPDKKLFPLDLFRRQQLGDFIKKTRHIGQNALRFAGQMHAIGMPSEQILTEPCFQTP